MRVFRGIKTYDLSRPFLPRLYRITLNETYGRLQRRRRRRAQVFGEEDCQEVAVFSNVEEALATWELARRAEEIIAQIPPEQGTILWMHDVAGVSAATLSELLHLPVPTMKSRLHRGRLLVRKRLLGIRGEPGPRAFERRAPVAPGDRVTGHEVVESLLLDYFEERLEAEDRARFEEHLSRCSECGPVVEGYAQVVRGLSRLPESEIPPEMIQATLNFLRESLEKGPTSSGTGREGCWPPSGAACAGSGAEGFEDGIGSLRTPAVRGSAGRFGLDLDAQAFRDPVDEVEVGGDGSHAVDLLIGEACPPQRLDVPCFDLARAARQEERVIDHRAQARRQHGAVRIRRHSVGQIIPGQSTERRPVVRDSVMAAVGGGDGDGDRLTLGARNPRRSVLDRNVEREMRPADLRLDAMDLEDVGDQPAAAGDLRLVLGRLDITNVSHPSLQARKRTADQTLWQHLHRLFFSALKAPPRGMG